MKIAISATGPSLDSDIDPRFGRTEYFVIVDPETMLIETLRNPGLGAVGGAGISTAELICNKGVGAVITGSIGPKAHQVLSAAGIHMLEGVSGRIDEAIERFKSGELAEEPTSVPAPAKGPGSGVGSGGGGRRGGMGVARGMGCGTGRGGGKGLGMGRCRSGVPGRSSFGDRESEPWQGRSNAREGGENIVF